MGISIENNVNKIRIFKKKVSFLKSSEDVQNAESVSYCAVSDNEYSYVILNKLVLNARRLYWDT